MLVGAGEVLATLDLPVVLAVGCVQLNPSSRSVELGVQADEPDHALKPGLGNHSSADYVQRKALEVAPCR